MIYNVMYIKYENDERKVLYIAITSILFENLNDEWNWH